MVSPVNFRGPVQPVQGDYLSPPTGLAPICEEKASGWQDTQRTPARHSVRMGSPRLARSARLGTSPRRACLTSRRTGPLTAGLAKASAGRTPAGNAAGSSSAAAE